MLPSQTSDESAHDGNKQHVNKSKNKTKTHLLGKQREQGKLQLGAEKGTV